MLKSDLYRHQIIIKQKVYTSKWQTNEEEFRDNNHNHNIKEKVGVGIHMNKNEYLSARKGM